jgi:hypothetical protein
LQPHLLNEGYIKLRRGRRLFNDPPPHIGQEVATRIQGQ